MTPCNLTSMKAVQLLDLRVNHATGVASVQLEVGLVDPQRLIILGKLSVPPGALTEGTFNLLRQLTESLERDAAAYLGGTPAERSAEAASPPPAAVVEEEGGLHTLIDTTGADRPIGSV